VRGRERNKESCVCACAGKRARGMGERGEREKVGVFVQERDMKKVGVGV